MYKILSILIVIGTVALFWFKFYVTKTEISLPSFINAAPPATQYIHAVDWPPKVQVIDQPYSCVSSGSEVLLGGQTAERSIGGREYCVTRESEGAAGSIYTNYSYKFPQADKTGLITFTLRSVQCDNYDDPEKSACKEERSAFDPDSIVLLGN